FVPLLEDSGLIVPVGAWVLEEACRQLATWRRAGQAAAELSVSVNVAPRQLMQPEFAATVARALELSGANPRQLCLEITEAALIEDIDAARRELGKLRQLGVRLAVDDYGTGYASVGYVRQLPLDVVKIDERFEQTIAAIDAANAEDPHDKELRHAELATAWVRRLRPEASEALLLAARGHHIRRWAIPRSSYPEGRRGYLRWRRDLQRAHAADLAGILAAEGYDEATVARVQDIVQKKQL